MVDGDEEFSFPLFIFIFFYEYREYIAGGLTSLI